MAIIALLVVAAVAGGLWVWNADHFGRVWRDVRRFNDSGSCRTRTFDPKARADGSGPDWDPYASDD